MSLSEREQTALDLFDACKRENERLVKELSRAYRALHGFYNCNRHGERPTDGMLAYHGPTIGAAARFVREGSLEGADYFEGKQLDVLREALKP